MPLLVDQTVDSQPAATADADRTPALAEVSRPRPIVMSSIELLDPELRARCLNWPFKISRSVKSVSEVAVEQINDVLERIEATFPGTRFEDISNADAMTERWETNNVDIDHVPERIRREFFQHPVQAWVGKRVNITLRKLPLNIRDTIGARL